MGRDDGAPPLTPAAGAGLPGPTAWRDALDAARPELAALASSRR